ncbi:ROK family transcriptional regulator [Plantactinospora sp. B5E13]|uniref:ROK family transcriptional regulator n=1 Tax=unclassified Plantactinospora TaxID=2631981 RepID=UPI00325CF95B
MSQVLAVLARRPGITRAEMARELGLASGLATEITARMRELRLLTEAPAPVRGRGRPTTVLRPHPEGPVVLAVDVRQGQWRQAVITVEGQPHELRHHRHRSRRPETVLGAVRKTIDHALTRYGGRLRAVSLAVAATIHDRHLVQASTLGWGPVDLDTLTSGTSLPLLIGNDATLAAAAEARTGAATAAGTALHLIVEAGIGGALTIDGRPVTGAHGAAGEYGHLPLGDRELRCPCGARGCWELEVDGRALARHLGEPAPTDPHGYTRDVLNRTGHDTRARQAVTTVAQALAAGIAGLVNIHDPDLITLGGLGPALRDAARVAFQNAYTGGLMTSHRTQPPPVVDATHGDDGPLRGAAIIGLDHTTSEAALANWATSSRSPDRGPARR